MTFRVCRDIVPHLFLLLEEDECGHGGDAVVGGGVLGLVHVHLQEDDGAVALLPRQLLDLGGDRLARRAPV